MTSIDIEQPAIALHRTIVERHWRGDGLAGPDMGIRFNYRLWRFVKSYLSALPWRDELYYQQAQAYWILGNWLLLDATGDGHFADLAVASARGMMARQRPDGAWEYPNPEWRGRIATTEGTWAAIALTETRRRTGDESFLESATRWHEFLEKEIGYQMVPGGLAFGYFAGRQGPPVPNNSADVIRLLAELAEATGDNGYLDKAPGLLGFLAQAQRASGEFPYQVDVDGTGVRLPHFQCPQYNAFQCLDLIRYRRLTGDATADPVISGLLRFLAGKVDADGQLPYACDHETPRVTYHLGAVAAALREGERLGYEGCRDPSDRALRRLLDLQKSDGGFSHSRQNYRFLRDDRSYPRTLAMILYHLALIGAESETS